MLAPAIVAFVLLLTAPVRGAAQEAPPAAEGVTASAEQPIPELGLGEMARIAPDLVLRNADFDRYLGTVHSRLPAGDVVLQQLLSEALILQAASRAGIRVDEADVETALLSLEQRAREATGGEQGVTESLSPGVSQDDLRAAVRLLVLHERLVRAESNLAADVPIEPLEMQAWLDAETERAELTLAPLDDAQAATWSGGTISKAAVGNRLRRMLSPEDLSGVLTEMIGVLLVRREAARRGIDLTATDATQEILHRDAALRRSPGAGDVTYNRYLEAIEKRTLEELLKSEKFATEVLLRKITDQDWTEESARALWEERRELFAADGVTGTWEQVRESVWRQLRQRTYTAIFGKSRIARRF